jgi:hypothetical protein
MQEFCEQNGLEKYVEVMRDNEVDLGTLVACARIHYSVYTLEEEEEYTVAYTLEA